MPGWTKPSTVAWFCTHRHHPANGDEYYQFSYLFRYTIDLPNGTKSIKLPDNAKVRIFAITAVQNDTNRAVALQPLSDTLKDHVAGDAPRFRSRTSPITAEPSRSTRRSTGKTATCTTPLTAARPPSNRRSTPNRSRSARRPRSRPSRSSHQAKPRKCWIRRSRRPSRSDRSGRLNATARTCEE